MKYDEIIGLNTLYLKDMEYTYYGHFVITGLISLSSITFLK